MRKTTRKKYPINESLNLFFEMQNRVQVRRHKNGSSFDIFRRFDNLVQRHISIETDQHVTDIFVSLYSF